MDVALLANNSSTVGEYAATGLKNLGYRLTGLVPKFFNGPWNWDLMVLVGLRKYNWDVHERCKELNIPCVSFDLPHFRNGDWRLHPCDHTWIPPVEGSRNNRIGVDVKPRKRGRPKGDILVIGQVESDSSHRMNNIQYGEWANKACSWARENLTGDVVWRPHPNELRLTPEKRIPIPRCDRVSECSIEEALDKAQKVLVYSSTVGLDALIRGCHVIAWGKSCYSHLVSTPDKDRRPATKEEVKSLVDKLTFTQWSPEEIKTGKCFNFIMDYV